MTLRTNGVECDCGKFHKFDDYYYGHTHIELMLMCDCGRSCIVRNGQIKAQSPDEKASIHSDVGAECAAPILTAVNRLADSLADERMENARLREALKNVIDVIIDYARSTLGIESTDPTNKRTCGDCGYFTGEECDFGPNEGAMRYDDSPACRFFGPVVGGDNTGSTESSAGGARTMIDVDEDGNDVSRNITVPLTTINEIMAVIDERADFQHTRCAVCGIDKPTPLRRDEMGGYVCLTCVDKRLDEIDGLREALEKIGKLSTDSRSRHIDDYGEIARAALKGGE